MHRQEIMKDDVVLAIPLYGITLSGKEIVIGDFLIKTVEQFKEDISEIEPSLYLKDSLINNLKTSQVLLITKQKKDSEEISKIVITQIKRLLDVLNWIFSQTHPYNLNHRNIVSLHEVGNESISYTKFKGKTGSESSRYFAYNYVVLPIDISTIEHNLYTDDFLWLVELISKDENNDYHVAVIKSIYWFSQFLMENKSDHKLLYLVTSLEVLLSEESRIKQSISSRIGLILGQNEDHRLRLVELFKKLYKLRSDITHGNKINIVEDRDLYELKYITSATIRYAIKNRHAFESLKNFRKSIDKISMV